MQDISIEKATQFADPDCTECDGTGLVWMQSAPDNGEQHYCRCVKENMAQHEAESREQES